MSIFGLVVNDNRDVFASIKFKQGKLLSSGVTRVTLWPKLKPV